MTFRVQINSIADVTMGQSPNNEDVNSIGNGHPLLNGPTEFTLHHPKPVQYTTNGRKFSAPSDILFCVRGSTTGKMNYSDQKYAIGRGIAAIKGKNGYPTPFIRAVIENNLDKLLVSATGSTFPNIGKDLLLNFEVDVISKEEANTVNNLIVSFENKIELNRQTNQTLEQIAQAMFKSWFVDFEPTRAKIAAKAAGATAQEIEQAAMRAISGKTQQALNQLPQTTQQTLKATAKLFPEAMEESELGEIPQGWEVKSLSTIANYLNGLALQKFRPKEGEKSLPVLKISQLKKGYAEGEELASANIKPEYIVENGDVVFSWSGSLEVDIWCGGKAALNQHLFKVTSDSVPKWFYYFWTKQHLESFQQIAADKAVTMGHIKRSHLDEAKCAVPNFDLSHFLTIDHLINKQISMRIENFQLAELRDNLLPKLLSGELAITELSEELT